MKAIWEKYKIYIIVAAVLLVLLAYWFFFKKGKAGNLTGLYSYNAQDEAAFKAIYNWVAVNDPGEFAWWQSDIQMYMPGGSRGSVGQYGLVPDLPNGGISKTQRIRAAMNELRFNADPNNIGCNVTDKQAFDFGASVYNPLISSFIA
jgi:hypothetical protein